ncbi:MAG: fused MFS/spermidine synthase [Burkholderiales bacterium]
MTSPHDPIPTVTTDPDPHGTRAARVLAVAFFASGVSALLCQIVWQRVLGIFAGSDTVSASLVVGAFLSGLGLGSIAGARIADRLSPRASLTAFALAEVGVAVFALLSKPFLHDLLATRLAGVVDAPGAIFALCFAGLVLPTTLMGASLPLLSRAVATSLASLAERVGRLYGLNTVGAGVGALVGGWVLVGTLGFVGTLAVAAACSLAAAAVAMTLRAGLPHAGAAPSRPTGPAAGAPGVRTPGFAGWCALVFVSGYVIVALEIVWVRVLGQIGTFHAYLFPTVLGIFLLADGLGIAVASRWVRRVEDPRRAFLLLQAGGFAAAAVLLAIVWWAVPAWPLVEVLSVDDLRIHLRAFAVMGVLAVLVVGPPAFLIGATFPFVQKAVQQDLESVGERVGRVQLANIAGNAAGAIVTGLVTLHWLGTAGTLKLLAALSALLLAARLVRGPRDRAALAVGAACAVALVALPSNAAFWARLHGAVPGQAVAWAEDRSGVAYWREDRDAEGRIDSPFFIQGFSQGRVPYIDIHRFLGAIGPLLHPDPRRLLVIGVGSGGTPWSAGVLGDAHVDAIELVGPVLEVHRQLAVRDPGSPSATMLSDPRWRLVEGDGRRLLARERTRWDVIEADALLPETSLSGLLYSREFMNLARARLADRGLYVQWTPTCRAVDTFRRVFPHAVLLLPARVMVGSDAPIELDPEALRRRFADPAVRAHLSVGGGAPPDADVLVRMIVRWTGDGDASGAPLTDLAPKDEFFRNARRLAILGLPDGDARDGPPRSIEAGTGGGDALAAVPGCAGLSTPTAPASAARR